MPESIITLQVLHKHSCLLYHGYSAPMLMCGSLTQKNVTLKYATRNLHMLAHILLIRRL